jgi:hypothetical protein
MRAARLANEIWLGANLARWRRFRRALRDPGRAQRRLLARCLKANAETEFGRRHRFGSLSGVEHYRQRVPLASYDDYRLSIDDIRTGHPNVLTRERVERLVPSSGSVTASKLIPYNRTLLAEFNRAIGPWVVDLYRHRPDLRNGPAYWAISPAEPESIDRPSEVPIGFDEDSAYLGGVLRKVVDRTLAVPGSIRRVHDTEAFKYSTLRLLLGLRELRLISVWHPSFLTLLVEPAGEHWDRLLGDIERGTLSPPAPMDTTIHEALTRNLVPDPGRAEQLARVGPRDTTAIWPRLGLISCWGDGHSGDAVGGLRDTFPGVEIQRKGLLATEAFVSLPYEECRPVAVRSHFFEFIDDDGRSKLVDELRRDAEYSVVVTTGGGLYRYRMGDRVRVDGFVERTPSLRFIGREDRVSDRFGEKLNDAYVSRLLNDILQPVASEVSFVLLAPDERDEGVGYTLFLECRRDPPSDLADRLERGLRRNYHYRCCVKFGQLAPARVFRVRRGAYRIYTEACRRKGTRIGAVKPTALSAESGWRPRFEGAYSDVVTPSVRSVLATRS